jgi:hypothetical protein
MTGIDITLAESGGLDADERRRLAALADVLIPAAHGMPSASQVGVADRWVDDTLRLRPELRQVLRRALDGLPAGADPRATLVRLASDDTEAFEVLGTVVAGSYYMAPEVRTSLGYPGQEARPLVDDTPQYLDMLERVVDRGPVYRPTPA